MNDRNNAAELACVAPNVTARSGKLIDISLTLDQKTFKMQVLEGFKRVMQFELVLMKEHDGKGLGQVVRGVHMRLHSAAQEQRGGALLHPEPAPDQQGPRDADVPAAEDCRRRGLATACRGHRVAAMKPLTWFASRGFVSACLAAASTAALSQSYPSKPIRIIVPYAAGGAVDASARTVGSVIAESVGVPVVVENRPGGSSIVGMLACGKAAPDGYTTCMTVADSLSYNPFLFKNLPYDPDRDFAPVVYMARSHSLLFAKRGAPFNSIREMIAYAKAKPGALNWGTWGPASIPDMYLAWIKAETGVNIAAVPYKGVGQAVPAALAGDIDITFGTIGTVMEHFKAGRLKPLAVVSSQRFPGLPDVPSLAEEKLDPGLRTYFGVFATGGTPRPVVDRLNAEWNKALQSPRIQEFLRSQTLDYVGGSAQDFADFLRTDRNNAGRIFKALGVSPTDAPS